MCAASKKSSLVLVVALIAALAAAGGYFFVSSKGKKITERVATWITKNGFSASSVTVDFWDKALVITDLKGTIPWLDGAAINFTYERVSASGIHFDAFETSGPSLLADSLTLTNTLDDFSYPPQSDVKKRTLRCKSFTLNNLRGDFAAILKETEGLNLSALANSPEEVKKHAMLWDRLFTLATAWHADSLSMTGCGDNEDLGTGAPFTIAMDSYEATDVSLLEIGSSVARKISYSVMGMVTINIDFAKVGRESYSPEVLLAILRFSSQNFDNTFRQALEKGALQIRDALLKDISLTVMMMPEKVTLKSLRLDTDLGLNAAEMQFSFEDLVVPSSLYSLISDEAAMFGKVHARPLTFAGGFEASGSHKDGKARLTLQGVSVTEKDLGSLTLDMTMVHDNLPNLLAVPETEWRLASARCVLEDVQTVGTFLRSQVENARLSSGEMQMPPDIADIRAAVAAEVREDAAREGNPDTKATLEGLVKLVERPGALSIDVKPEKPMPLDVFQYGDEFPGAYNITTSFTPAADAK